MLLSLPRIETEKRTIYCGINNSKRVHGYTNQAVKMTAQRSSPLRGPLLHFLVFDGVKHNFVHMAGRHARVALGPVVRDSVGENRAGAVEGRAGHGARGSFERWSMKATLTLSTWVTSRVNGGRMTYT